MRNEDKRKIVQEVCSSSKNWLTRKSLRWICQENYMNGST